LVVCSLCPHRCRIAPGKRGICRVRENREGKLLSLIYGRPAAAHVDPIEKKPLYHFLPGSKAFSVSTIGCNLSCPFCQNHTLSVVSRERLSFYSETVPAKEVVERAEDAGCLHLCFTYSEPTIYYEYMLDMARLAKDSGLTTSMVSNGYIEKGPLEELAPFMDAANIDLKAFKEETYREVLGGKLEPVKKTIRRMKQQGVWVEVTTLVVPQMNDSEQELTAIAEFLADTGTEIPWHVSRFHPCHKRSHLPPTPIETLMTALECGKRAGLKYIYAGNVPGELSESTCCPGCGKVVIARWGFGVGEVNLDPEGNCNHCGNAIDGIFKS
jgi:pyruvate formate lyase activating enzyme